MKHKSPEKDEARTLPSAKNRTESLSVHVRAHEQSYAKTNPNLNFTILTTTTKT